MRCDKAFLEGFIQKGLPLLHCGILNVGNGFKTFSLSKVLFLGRVRSQHAFHSRE